jgi:hypothetical protein
MAEYKAKHADQVGLNAQVVARWNGAIAAKDEASAAKAKRQVHKRRARLVRVK